MFERRLSTFFPILAIALLALASFWLQHVVTQTETSDRNKNDSPDGIVNHAVMQRFGSDGTLRYILWSEQSTHYPNDDRTQVESPRIRFVGTRRPMEWSSNTALIEQHGNRVVMQGNVEGHGLNTVVGQEERLRTTQMIVFPEEQRAQTDQPVQIERGASILNGIGMRVDNVHGLLQIDRVRARLYSKTTQP